MLKLTRTGGEERGMETGTQPSARIASQSCVHARAEFDRLYCPLLPGATWRGAIGRTIAPTIRSGI